MKKILHLTQTDIRSDSRILKAIDTAATSGYKVLGVGVDFNEGESESRVPYGAAIHSTRLISKRLKYLPKLLVHFSVFCEFFIRSIALSIKYNPDLIHCNDTLVLPIGVIVKIFTKSKLVYDAHELESNRNALSPYLGKLTLFIERVLWRFVDALIVVSPSIQTWYRKYVGDKESEVVLNSPAIKEDTRPKRRSYLRDRFGIPEESKIFLYIGILAPGRGIELLVEVFSQAGIKSSLVFLGYGEMSGNLHQVASEHNNIYVHGAVSHGEVVSIASSADMGFCLIQNVSLSDYYSLPNKLFEYCFAGIPVMASNFPDISDVVRRYNLGMCVDLDVASITEAVEKFEAGSIDVSFDVADLDELSWAAQAGKLTRLYRKILI